MTGVMSRHEKLKWEVSSHSFGVSLEGLCPVGWATAWAEQQMEEGEKTFSGLAKISLPSLDLATEWCGTLAWAPRQLLHICPITAWGKPNKNIWLLVINYSLYNSMFLGQSDQCIDTYNWFEFFFSSFLLFQSHLPEITYKAGAEGKKLLPMSGLLMITGCLNGLERIQVKMDFNVGNMYDLLYLKKPLRQASYSHPDAETCQD